MLWLQWHQNIHPAKEKKEVLSTASLSDWWCCVAVVTFSASRICPGSLMRTLLSMALTPHRDAGSAFTCMVVSSPGTAEEEVNSSETWHTDRTARRWKLDLSLAQNTNLDLTAKKDFYSVSMFWWCFPIISSSDLMTVTKDMAKCEKYTWVGIQCNDVCIEFYLFSWNSNCAFRYMAFLK